MKEWWWDVRFDFNSKEGTAILSWIFESSMVVVGRYL